MAAELVTLEIFTNNRDDLGDLPLRSYFNHKHEEYKREKCAHNIT